MTDRVNENMRTERENPTETDLIFPRFFPEPENRKIYPTNILPNKKIERLSKYLEKNIIKNDFENPSLILFNSLILERDDINERIDSFILERIVREFPERRTALAQQDLPTPRRDEKQSFSSLFTGISAFTTKGADVPLTIKGEKVVFNYGEYTAVHFGPGGRRRFIPSQMTDSLTKGIQGIMEMIEAIDKGEFKTPGIFVGETNINMALIAQRFGFVIVDECRTPDGNINRDLKIFTVVGKFEDIKARAEEFKRAGVGEKLSQRNERLKFKPKPVPVG